jgi:NADH dehydrogenase/NADH:ubiquinone oxidoreductase subunit G
MLGAHAGAPLQTLSFSYFYERNLVLEVARAAGIYTIPILCYLKDTTATGSCRMCMVEVEGARTLLPACATTAAPGMVIKTESDRIDAARQMVLELLLASGNHNCLVCEANGVCELQALAYRYQVPTPSFANPPDTAYDLEDNKHLIRRNFPSALCAVVVCGPAMKSR